MGEIQMPHCFGDVTRLIGIEPARRLLAYRAKPTMPRANVAPQHKGRSPISPALEDVRTPRFLTNRVQVQALNQVEQMVLIGWITEANPQPLGFRLTSFGVQNLKFAARSEEHTSELQSQSNLVCRLLLEKKKK